MEHQDIIKKLEAYVDGELSKDESLIIEKHINECAECKSRYQVLQGDLLAGERLMKFAQIEERPSSFDQKVMKAIDEVSAAKEQHKILDKVGEDIWSSRILKKGLAFAASILFLVVAVFGYNNFTRGFKPIIIASRGSAKVYISSKAMWVDAKPGICLQSDDQLRLGKHAQVDIEASKLYKIRVKPDSRISFDKIAKNYNSKMQIDVEQGKIMISTKPRFKGSSLKVTTPAAEATALGTVFMVDVNPLQGGITTVGVSKGNVLVEGKDIPKEMLHFNKVVVKEGHKTYVRPGEVPTVPEIFSDKEWKAMEELYRIAELPQVALLIGSTADRVEELMRPCMLYIYDAKPRTLPEEFDDAIRLIKKAVDTNSMDLHIAAAEELKRLISEYPSKKYDVQFYLFLGAYYYFLKDYDESLKIFDKIINDIKDSNLTSLAICAKAFIYENGLKDLKKANEIYSRIIIYYPDTPEAEYAKKILR